MRRGRRPRREFNYLDTRRGEKSLSARQHRRLPPPSRRRIVGRVAAQCEREQKQTEYNHGHRRGVGGRGEIRHDVAKNEKLKIHGVYCFPRRTRLAVGAVASSAAAVAARGDGAAGGADVSCWRSKSRNASVVASSTSRCPPASAAPCWL